MNAPFLCGVLAAWAIAQLAVGGFFVLAYSLRRREAEYLLFGMLCVAMAAATAGLSLAYGATSLEDRLVASQLTQTGTIVAAPLNLHFVMRYVGVAPVRKIAVPIYALAAVFMLTNWLGFWWAGEVTELRTGQVLGFEVTHMLATPGPLARAFYLSVAFEFVASLLLLARAFRQGSREALSALSAALLVGAAIVNDILLVLGVIDSSIYMVPHAFLVFAFAVASTLLQRYRITAGELEQTISSLRQRTEELRHSNAELRLVQDELVRKQQLAAVGELAAAIAHEVRNPLAVIVNAVSGLRRDGVRSEDRVILLDIVDEETARLNRLVTDLLRFARPVSVNRSKVSLVEMCQQTQAVAGSEHRVELDVPDDEALHTIWADANLFRLVLDNLVDNACQAMKGGGTVSIRLLRDELQGVPTVRIDIADSGHGMEVEVLDRATDPFFTTRPSGTGLGLPIVQRIIRAHGGELVLESELGAGTRASIHIPLGEPREAPDLRLGTVA